MSVFSIPWLFHPSIELCFIRFSVPSYSRQIMLSSSSAVLVNHVISLPARREATLYSPLCQKKKTLVNILRILEKHVRLTTLLVFTGVNRNKIRWWSYDYSSILPKNLFNIDDPRSKWTRGKPKQKKRRKEPKKSALFLETDISKDLRINFLSVFQPFSRGSSIEATDIRHTIARFAV